MSNIRSKLINAENMVMAGLTAGAAAGVGYYNSFNNNNLSHHAKDIAEKIGQIIPDASNTVNVTNLAATAQTLGNDLYKASRAQGITLDVALCVIALPSFLVSVGHHAGRNGMGWIKYATSEWDYHLGRGLQLAGFGLMGKGIHADGESNPQTATAFVGAAPVTIAIGTFFVERNRGKHMKAAQDAAAQNAYQPLSGINVSAPVEGQNNPVVPAYSAYR